MYLTSLSDKIVFFVRNKENAQQAEKIFVVIFGLLGCFAFHKQTTKNHFEKFAIKIAESGTVFGNN